MFQRSRQGGLPVPSRRAAILREMLAYINADDWQEYDGFVVFGKRAFDDLGTQSSDTARGLDDDDVRDLQNAIQTDVGASDAAHRLGSSPGKFPNLESLLRSWPQTQRDALRSLTAALTRRGRQPQLQVQD